MRNPWLAQTGGNPYRRTAFQILAIGKEVTAPQAIRQRADQKLRRVERGQELLFDQPLSPAEITSACERLTDPRERIVEEILTHSPAAKIDLSSAKEVLNALEQWAASPDAETLVVLTITLEGPDYQTLVALVPESLSPRNFEPIHL